MLSFYETVKFEKVWLIEFCFEFNLKFFNNIAPKTPFKRASVIKKC